MYHMRRCIQHPVGRSIIRQQRKKKVHHSRKSLKIRTWFQRRSFWHRLFQLLWRYRAWKIGPVGCDSVIYCTQYTVVDPPIYNISRCWERTCGWHTYRNVCDLLVMLAFFPQDQHYSCMGESSCVRRRTTFITAVVRRRIERRK